MTKLQRRVGLLAAVCVTALGITGQALAAFTPSFSAVTTLEGTNINYSQAQTDDPLASVSFYVASGYTALLADPEGTQIGTVTARALAIDLNNTILPLTGQIVAAAPTTVVGGVPLSTPATACTGTATHNAYWLLNLSASGQTLQVPVFVDDIPITSPLADIANNKVTICLPPPDVPTGTPGRATFGAKLLSANLVLGNFSVPPGVYPWHMTATPYTPASGKVNAAATVDVQSTDRTPQAVTLSGKGVAKKKKTVAVSGRVTAGGEGVAGVNVSILIGKKAIGSFKTKAGGAYAGNVKLPTAAASLTAKASAPARTFAAGSCTGVFPPVPCIGATTAPFVVTSKPVRVKAKA
jgi:hypothetical protein